MVQRVVSHTPEFDRALAKLARKYRDLPATVKSVFLKAQESEPPPGDRIPIGLSDVFVYKVRVSCGNQGKRGGARIIYYRAEALVVGLFVYTKNDISDIHSNVIVEALKAAELLPNQDDGTEERR